jgi:hypothetical protein
MESAWHAVEVYNDRRIIGVIVLHYSHKIAHLVTTLQQAVNKLLLHCLFQAVQN